MQMSIITAKISEVKFYADSLRQAKDTEDVRHLMNDIVKRGLLNIPTLVHLEGDNKTLYVKDGNRRMTALKMALEQKLIPDEMKFQFDNKPASPLDLLGDQISGNVNVKKTADKEYINALYVLASEGGLSMAELAEKAGMSISYLSKLFKTLRLPEEVLEKAEKKKVSIANLIDLSDLAGKIEDSEWDGWLNIASKMPSKDFSIEVEDAVNLIRKKAAAARKGKKLEFEVKKSLKKKDELLVLLASAEADFSEDPSPFNEGKLVAYKTIFSISDAEVELQKNKWEAKQEESEKKAEQRKLEREIQKAREAVAALKEKGIEINE